MKNRYSVVDEQATPNIVLATYPFAWMARAVAAARGGEKKGCGVAVTPTDPQVIINICHQRDTEYERSENQCRATNAALATRNELVDVLFGLVARGDDGRWTTVHDADVPLPEEAQKILDRVLG